MPAVPVWVDAHSRASFRKTHETFLVFQESMIILSPISLFAAAPGLWSVWKFATFSGKSIIVLLIIASVVVWAIMASKAKQLRKAKRLNTLFDQEFRKQESVLDIYERDVEVEGCPLYTVYKNGCRDLVARLHGRVDGRGGDCSLKSMDHVKGTLERTVAEESLNLESGLILLAIAVSGAPFLGLLGTVWGVMNVFTEVFKSGVADLPSMAPGLSAAMMTTVAGLLVAIPSMFGYNWLVHNLRVFTVRLDNFALELASRMETEFVNDTHHGH